LLKGAACARALLCRSAAPKKTRREEGRKNREKRREGKRERGRRRRGMGKRRRENEIRAKKKNRARARVQSTRASHESTTVGSLEDVGGEREREREREGGGGLHTFPSARVEAPATFFYGSGFAK